MKLIEIEEKKHDVTIDLKYSSVDNILGEKIFNENKCFLHPSAEKKLVKAVALDVHPPLLLLKWELKTCSNILFQTSKKF